MPPDDRPSQRRSQPLLDALGKLVVEGKDAATFLWQVPDDEATRARLRQILQEVREQSARKGRREMPHLCDELLTALQASPTPQQVDILQDGFDRLYKLWEAAKTGLV
ncbi:MAG: hypothetical protein A2W29_03535 [Gemmatimonadetes bacterium RBG_16_66_8]|nr:MAG: hypothetical protein A2W29_03535 [Gemmatimonadetes bacterium RBG_16_66_8]